MMVAPEKKDKLIIFDTSLRDGEQSPGVTLSAGEKVEIARALSRLGVDVCEAGFPIASQGDFDAVQRIAREVGPLTVGRKSGRPMVIAGLARAVPADIQRAYDAVKDAPLHRVHTFLATSDIHLEHKLRINRDECVQRAVAAVAFAKSLGCTDIEFSPEDAGRSDRTFLCKVLGEVILAGATTLNIPDTVGYNTPEEYGSMMKHLIENTPGGKNVTWSTHCHDDLGLATANTLSGIQNGARQVEVTMNGIGERAGNTALEEIVMAIYCKPLFFPVTSDIDTTMIYSTSQLVTKRSGMVIQPNKAIVGANAFAHESGIHQDGMLKNRSTYEIMEPAILGIPSNHLVLGKHSGRAAFKVRIEQVLGQAVYADKFKDAAVMDELFARFKKLADTKKRGVTDQDLYALLDDMSMSSINRETYKIKSAQVVSGSGVLATATVAILDYSNNATTPVERMDAAMGHGPVHAIFRCINRLTGHNNVLASYEVKAVTEGSDSLGKVLVRIQEGVSESTDDKPRIHNDEGQDGSFASDHASRFETSFQGQGTDEDILIASAKAYVMAINKLVDFKARKAQEPASAEVGKKRKVDVVGGQVEAIPKSRKVDV
ncbi:2-isopropylmalate synthase [Synchytrium microbalum]|uniref:2-isopropylmalate synthase n=1 Tax=Synchytrium microbalum TaxID=1806994 RepID=A0A507C264_9FUNG|nr:2-isopropylmalate synthase [Synchytrium microbalum]TPX33458.1 2-isopropylmalate synthase [Synchytrium microbalum]